MTGFSLEMSLLTSAATGRGPGVIDGSLGTWYGPAYGVHRALLERFPYSVHYAVEPDALIILAVFHHRRDPRKLEGRK